MKAFQGKVAVVTGAGRGIGRGIALRCAKEGMKIVLAGIGMDSLTKTNADLHAMGAETLIVQTDVSKLEDVENLAQRTIEVFGEVHMLVNNAGVGLHPPKPLWEHTIADWNWVVGVNMWGVVYGVHRFLPIMIDQDTPCHIVNVSSLAGLGPGLQNWSSYSASKQAVVGLSESLFYELAQHAPHIKVSAYCPGYISTEIVDGERSRPSRFRTNPAESSYDAETEEWMQNAREFFANSMPIEEAIDILFSGLQQDKLYIGVEGFRDQYEGLGFRMLQERFENILNERNPELPS